MRELRRGPEAAVHGIELAPERLDRLLEDPLVHRALELESPAALCEGLVEAFRVPERLGLVRPVVLRNREEDTAEARPIVRVLRREVRAPVEHLPVRREERGERPAAASGDRADG